MPAAIPQLAHPHGLAVAGQQELRVAGRPGAARHPRGSWSSRRAFAPPPVAKRDHQLRPPRRRRGALRATPGSRPRGYLPTILGASIRPTRKETRVPELAEVQSGLEGVVAFATEIAEPDKEGGALRYRGVDIEDLTGQGAVRAGLGPARGRLVRARPAARDPAPPLRAHRRPARGPAGGSGDAGAGVGAAGGHRHQRRAGPRRPGARVGHGALLRGAVRARHRPAAGAPDRGRQGPLDPRAVPDPLARRGRTPTT